MKNDENRLDRRSFLGGAIGAAGAFSAATMLPPLVHAQPIPRPAWMPLDHPAPASGGTTFKPLRAEVEVRDCVVEGKIPDDLNGGFYATGPDPQYPLAKGNIIFDGEGHVRMFRIKNGRVDYRTRYARTERYVAQDKARRSLMPMYRNPSMDDPSVKGLSRSTANTHVINHKNLILALKEDSPPCALDLNTLETVDPVYTFDGELPRDRPFTAHPKVCSVTGNIVAFGYEAEGFGSDVVAVFEIDKQGKKVWEAKIRVPYVGLLHDFAVTENHIMFFVIPLAIDHEQMKRGGIHWSWDPTKKTYLGYMRRYGDGKDIKWVEGPTRSGTHTMGAFEDKGKLYFDTEITAGNPFPFMPNRDGSPPDYEAATSYIHRLSLNVNGRNKSYGFEKMYPLIAPLPRQDDRYNTMPYRYGFMACPDPNEPDRRKAGACYARVDNQTRTFELWNAGPNVALAEPVFAPKHPKAREGEGYLMGVAYHINENMRSDLVILDAEHLKDGPIAIVKLPVQASPQVHGWWVREDQYPA
ncbi:MAG: carotenoid oxygenase family protein [Pseudomonadota bacterium]|jgi:Lignostilbene-alpha,beta-dioxygenase and related enzymes|nr:MAG: dioxygenase [Pseudomonadota bacterium]